MIKINGISLPGPVEFTVGIMDISKSDRNANGTMIREIIATKRKLEISWEHVTKAQYQQVLSAVSAAFFSVEYPDPQTGAMRTGTFYAGDRTITGLDYIQGVMHWKGVKFNVIER